MAVGCIFGTKRPPEAVSARFLRETMGTRQSPCKGLLVAIEDVQRPLRHPEGYPHRHMLAKIRTKTVVEVEAEERTASGFMPRLMHDFTLTLNNIEPDFRQYRHRPALARAAPTSLGERMLMDVAGTRASPR